MLRKIFQRSLDEIEKTNLIDSFCKESGLTLDNLNKFIDSHNTPDLVNSGEVIPELVKSFNSLLDDLLETDEEEGHGSESLTQDSNPESNDGGKLKRYELIQQKRQKLLKIQKIIQIKIKYQKEPRNSDKNNSDSKKPQAATEPTTGYDYGKPHYTDDDHIKHLLFDDNNIDNMTDEAKSSLLETRLADKQIEQK